MFSQIGSSLGFPRVAGSRFRSNPGPIHWWRTHSRPSTQLALDTGWQPSGGGPSLPPRFGRDAEMETLVIGSVCN